MIKRAFFTALLAVLAYGYGLAAKRFSSLNFDHEAVELIPTLTIDDLLGHIAQGDKVVFIDAREPEEFEEAHLPGAFNLALRDISTADVSGFRDASVIIAYCLKDFRGFEVGRALQDKGLKNVRMMKDHGINGWKKNHLPVAGRMGLLEPKAIERMKMCATDKNLCLQNARS